MFSGMSIALEQSGGAIWFADLMKNQQEHFIHKTRAIFETLSRGKLSLLYSYTLDLNLFFSSFYMHESTKEHRKKYTSSPRYWYTSIGQY